MNLARARELGISRQVEPALRGVTHVCTPRTARRRRSRRPQCDAVEEAARSDPDALVATPEVEPAVDCSSATDSDAEGADSAGAGAEPLTAHAPPAFRAAPGEANHAPGAPHAAQDGPLAAPPNGTATAEPEAAPAVAATTDAAAVAVHRTFEAPAVPASGSHALVSQAEGETLDLANWMAQLSGRLWDTPLHRIRLPGTHDSGAYALSRRHMAPSKLPRWLLRINRRAWWLTRPFSGLVACWGEAQRLDVAGQLLAGARYLDLRIVNVRGAFHVAHGMLGASCASVLQQVASFLDAHPGEVVVADCNHFHHFKGRADHEAFIALISECLGRHLAPREIRAPDGSVTLGALVAAGRRCVLLYGGCDFLGVAAAAAAARCWPRTQREIVSPWPRAASWSDLRARMTVLDAAGARLPCFFVLQGVVTPNARLIRRGLLRRPSSLRQVAAEVTPDVVRLVASGGVAANCIVLLDHIDLADVGRMLAAAYAPHLQKPLQDGFVDGVALAVAPSAEAPVHDGVSVSSLDDSVEALDFDGEADADGGWMDGAEAWAETADAPLLAQLSSLLREGHFAPGAIDVPEDTCGAAGT